MTGTFTSPQGVGGLPAAPAVATTLPTGITPGDYTFICPANVNPFGLRGTGWGLLTLSASGAATVAGRLNDDTPFSAAGRLLADGSLPIFATPYAKFSGVLGGSLTFSTAIAGNLNGGFTWKRGTPKGTAPPPAGGLVILAHLSAAGSLFASPAE